MTYNAEKKKILHRCISGKKSYELLVLFSFFFWPLKKVCFFFETEILGGLFRYIYFCFILLFTSSLPCRDYQFAVAYFSTTNSHPYRLPHKRQMVNHLGSGERNGF